jgi:hypothetical protein
VVVMVGGSWDGAESLALVCVYTAAVPSYVAQQSTHKSKQQQQQAAAPLAALLFPFFLLSFFF